MEATHHQFPGWPWLSWDGDTFNEDTWNNIPENLDDSHNTGNSLQFLAPDAHLAPQISATDRDLNEPAVLGLSSKPMDYIPDLGLPEFALPVMTEMTSPTSLGSATWASSPLDFDFNSPMTDMMFQLAAGRTNNAYMEEEFVLEAPSIAPWDTVQQSLPKPTAAPGPLTMEDRPPGVSAREWRKMIRPEKCPACGKGHTYQNELDKHIAAQHPHLAAEHGVSTNRHFCVWCPKSFARPDHLTRHLRLKHGRPRKKRNRG
jgi:hypothetical protein